MWRCVLPLRYESNSSVTHLNTHRQAQRCKSCTPFLFFFSHQGSKTACNRFTERAAARWTLFGILWRTRCKVLPRKLSVGSEAECEARAVRETPGVWSSRYTPPYAGRQLLRKMQNILDSFFFFFFLTYCIYWRGYKIQPSHCERYSRLMFTGVAGKPSILTVMDVDHVDCDIVYCTFSCVRSLGST